MPQSTTHDQRKAAARTCLAEGISDASMFAQSDMTYKVEWSRAKVSGKASAM